MKFMKFNLFFSLFVFCLSFFAAQGMNEIKVKILKNNRMCTEFMVFYNRNTNFADLKDQIEKRTADLYPTDAMTLTLHWRLMSEHDMKQLPQVNFLVMICETEEEVKNKAIKIGMGEKEHD